MTRAKSTLLLLLVFLGLPSLGRSQDTPLRPPLDTKDIDSRLRTDWYGLYLKGDKMGYYRQTRERRGDIVRESYFLNMKVTAFGQQAEMTIEQSLDFDSVAPFALRSGTFTQEGGGVRKEITVARTAAGFDTTLKVGADVRKKAIGKIDLTLADQLALDLWLKGSPKVGDSATIRDFEMEELESDLQDNKILAVKNSLVSGVQVRFFEIESMSRKQGVKMLSRMDETGKLLSGNFAIFELRLEPEEQAKNTKFSKDLFILGMVKADKALGGTSSVSQLVIEAPGKDAEGLQDGPRQSVSPLAGGGSVIKIGKQFGKQTKATAKEIEESLAETNEYPIHDAKVKALADKAVAGAKTPVEKVKKLVEFVNDYVHPKLSPNMPELRDLIERKQGDCKSYAMLFTALARAEGIPARVVSGLLYMGDDEKAFGGHAWNEVALDGIWVPVDASCREVEIDATHVSFGSERRATSNLLETLGKLSFHVVEVK